MIERLKIQYWDITGLSLPKHQGEEENMVISYRNIMTISLKYGEEENIHEKLQLKIL